MPQETRDQAIKRIGELSRRVNEHGVMHTDDLLESRRLRYEHKITAAETRTAPAVETRDASTMPETRNDAPVAEQTMTRAQWAALQVNETETPGGVGPRNLEEADAIRARYANTAAPREIGERRLVGTNAPPEYRGEDPRNVVGVRADQSLSAYYAQMPESIRNPSGLDLGSFDRNAFWRQLITRNTNGREYRALAEGSSTVSATGAGWTVPVDFASRILDLLRANLVFTAEGADGSINGPVVYDMPTNISYVPVWSADAANTGQFVPENTQITPGTPSIGYAYLQANLMATNVLVSRQAIDDSQFNLAELVERQLALAMARTMDSSFLYGTGHGNSQPPGLFTSAYTGQLQTVSMGTNGAALSSTYSAGGTAGMYGPFLQSINQVRAVNDEPNLIACHPNTAMYADSGLSTLNTYVEPPPMLDRTGLWPPKISTAFSTTETQGSSNAATSALACNSNRIILGLRRGLSFMQLHERYADFLQYGFIAYVRYDVNYPYVTAMSRVNGILV